jgi:hypothetical protein
LLLLSFSPPNTGLINATIKPSPAVSTHIKGKTSETTFSSKQALFARADVLYDSMSLETLGLNRQAFEYAWEGYQHLLKKGKLNREDILSICDFSQSSRKKRLFIIDVANKKVLLNTYVAHGRNSGGEYAYAFSNRPESLQSSLGFYLTRNTYFGEHGLSLRIDGLEKGFNDRADKRNIVVHGAEYVGPDFYNNFSGRSFGCPAIPSGQSATVINTIKNGSCLFIYHPTKKYLTQSKILNG